VAPTSNKVNNLVFRLWNQARPLHSIAHVFKTIAPICIIFGTHQCRTVLNLSDVFIFISCFTHSHSTWRKTTTRFSVWKKTKLGFLKPTFSLLQSAHYAKSTAWTSFFHVCRVRSSAAKRIRGDVTIHWCLTFARLSARRRRISSLQQAQRFLLFRTTWTASVFTVCERLSKSTDVCVKKLQHAKVDTNALSRQCCIQTSFVFQKRGQNNYACGRGAQSINQSSFISGMTERKPANTQPVVHIFIVWEF